ncbi:hypothetical protein [Paraflavitalea speifideaquila]|nr:hypothetical protein [Paraflavitalea speifideiaquila]
MLAVITAGILVFAATRPGKTADDDVCSESKDQKEKQRPRASSLSWRP